jgi:hypothetical protein
MGKKVANVGENKEGESKEQVTARNSALHVAVLSKTRQLPMILTRSFYLTWVRQQTSTTFQATGMTRFHWPDRESTICVYD